MEVSVGSLIFRLRATAAIAPSKQADHPAANSCSGFVPAPGAPGIESLMSSRRSELRDVPSRPPVVWVLAVYTSFSPFTGTGAPATSFLVLLLFADSGSNVW